MIRVSGLVKTFPDRRHVVYAVHEVSFQVPEGKFYTLLGPSGCGKTTTLRCIAGLERPDSGEIDLAGLTVFSSGKHKFVAPYRRPVGMVFQTYAIWPHMTVFENVAFPLRVDDQRHTAKEIKSRVESALAMVQLDGLESRGATRLSGGQQQRLALARALIREPKVLLLDEPLSNLDAQLREHMRVELRELQQRLGITTLYVTHDQVEALSMSDVIAVMKDGRIVQEGTPADIYNAPRAEFVAEFIGSPNILRGRLLEPAKSGVGRFSCVVGELSCTARAGLRVDQEAILIVRSENVVIHREASGRQREASGRQNTFRGTVGNVQFLGESLDCRIELGGGVIIHTRQHPSLGLQRGESVWVELPSSACMALAAGGETANATA